MKPGKAAGGATPRVRRYTDDELLDLLRRAAAELGHTPGADELRRMEGYPRTGTYQRRFGSWSEAVRKAGLVPRPRGVKRFTDDELLDLLRMAAVKLGRTPRVIELKGMDDYPSPVTYTKRFGSWDDAVRRAGLAPRSRVWRRYTDEELIDALQRAAGELGRAPTSKDLERTKGLPAPLTYQTRFGSWSNALRAAGFTPGRSRYTDEELLDDLQRIASELGRTPNSEDLRKREGYANTGTYQARFGSWSEALRQAGFTAPLVRYTDDELIDALQHAAELLGRRPTADDLRDLEGLPDPTTYYDHFGTWQNALLAAGLTDRKHGMTLIGRFEQRVIAALDNGPRTIEQIALDENMDERTALKAVSALCRRGIVREVGPKRRGGHVRYDTVDDGLNKVLEREHKVFDRGMKGDVPEGTPSDRFRRLIEERRR